MRASIYQGTKYEISWSLEEDPITPDLVERIEDAGNELDINWKKSQFYPAIELLLDHFSEDEIRRRLYDEDPDLNELIKLAVQPPLDEDSEAYTKFIRLYLPVVMVILNHVE